MTTTPNNNEDTRLDRALLRVVGALTKLRIEEGNPRVEKELFGAEIQTAQALGSIAESLKQQNYMLSSMLQLLQEDMNVRRGHRGY